MSCGHVPFLLVIHLLLFKDGQQFMGARGGNDINAGAVSDIKQTYL